ncbi:MAG: hypothetical protein WA672_05375 [Candidatus Angelobacter sp.]
MRLRSAVCCHAILAVVIGAGSTCSAHGLAQLPAGFRLMLFQGTPSFSTTPPSPIDLGPSAVGVTTPHAFPQPLQINNPGTATLAISSLSFSSFDAAFTSESLFVLTPPITVPAGSFGPANVLFTPQAAGKRTVQLIVNDNAPGSPHIVEFTGTGVPVAANDIGIILDPNTASSVSVAAGSSATFPIWLLAGASSTNTNVTVQCTGGPTGTSCGLSDTSTSLTGSFGPTREKIMVTVSVPAKSALLFRGTRNLWWMAAFALGIVLVRKGRRNVARFTAIAALLVMGIFIISCGGSSGTGATGSNSLVITATPSPGTPHSLNVPLVVQ